MVMNRVKNTIKGICGKENKDYFAAELAGSITSLAVATLSNIIFSDLGFPKGLNSIATYITQSAFSIGASVAAYQLMHKEEDPQGFDTKKHVLLMAKTGSKASIVSGIAKLTLHYGLLATKLVPYYLSAPIAYVLPGSLSSYYRHKKNYENGILCINHNKENKEQKPASIDEIVC
jgi:hypothetical protein